VLGRELRDLFPVAFLPEHHALAIAIMSYNGRIEYGLLGDYDALPDIDVIADGIDAALAQLLAVARGGAASPARKVEAASANGSPAPILPPTRTHTKRGPAADMRAKRMRGSRPPRRRPPG
jgi:diacylglycerol O-acyltransferase / wax synthase